MSAFNVDVSSFFSNAVLGKHWKKGKQEESTTLVTNQHINLSSFSPQTTATTTGAKHTKPEVGRWVNRSGRGVANERVISTYCRFVSSNTTLLPVAASSYNTMHTKRSPMQRAKRASHGEAGCDGDTASRYGMKSKGNGE
jgi:hypothetical protein